ncbi:MAG: hypothetical protein WCS65_12120 [Verrucomicrobiae bacterium]
MMKNPVYYDSETSQREGQRISCDLCIYGATSAGICPIGLSSPSSSGRIR